MEGERADVSEEVTERNKASTDTIRLTIKAYPPGCCPPARIRARARILSMPTPEQSVRTPARSPHSPGTLLHSHCTPLPASLLVTPQGAGGLFFPLGKPCTARLVRLTRESRCNRAPLTHALPWQGKRSIIVITIIIVIIPLRHLPPVFPSSFSSTACGKLELNFQD